MEDEEDSWPFATYVINRSFVLLFGLPLNQQCTISDTCSAACVMCIDTPVHGTVRGIIHMHIPSILKSSMFVRMRKVRLTRVLVEMVLLVATETLLSLYMACS